MALMMRRKRYKFQVDLTINELTEVTFGKAILFAKIRQLDGGGFSDFSKRVEVSNHAVKYQETFTFPCKMHANASTGVLESCKCRISIRKEEKGGKNFRKIGFVDVDMAEYAGAGPSTQRYILQAYEQTHRLDNSMLNMTVNITLKEGDPYFQRLLTRQQPIQLPGEEDLTVVVADTLAVNSRAKLSLSDVMGAEENTHSRNSSSTSHPGNSIGNSSNSSQPALSRHSSDESLMNEPGLHTSSGSTQHHPGKRLSSSGSGSGGMEGTGTAGNTGGSLEKETRRRRIDSGRFDPEKVIDDLMKELELDPSTAVQMESSQGLQLYLGPDGEFRFEQPRINKQFKQVVIDKS
jgi:hypothetical protein